MPLAEDTKDTSLTGLGIVLPNATVVQDSSSSNHSVGFPRAPNVTNGNMVLKSSLRMRSLSNVEVWEYGLFISFPCLNPVL